MVTSAAMLGVETRVDTLTVTLDERIRALRQTLALVAYRAGRAGIVAGTAVLGVAR
jgi:hypothetical protein